MDITSPPYMIGSWVFWGSIILPTMYLNSSEEKEKKDSTLTRLGVLFGQFVVAGGLMALAPSVRPFLINPIPPISMALMIYLFKYSGKFDENKILQWVVLGSLVMSVTLPQLIVSVKKGSFVGGKYSGLEPGTLGYTAVSFVTWAIIIIQIMNTTNTEGAEGKTEVDKATTEAKKSFEDVSSKLGTNIPGLGALVPTLLKIAILVAFASVPDARELITNPITPVVAILAYVGLRWLNIASSIEIVAIALVSFLPQVRTLILNPVPPIVLPITFLSLGALGVAEDKIGPLTGVVGFAITALMQVIQDALPTLVSTVGLTLETGTFFYNNFSALAWYLVILPSTYFFLRGDENSKPSVEMSREVKDIIQIAQTVLVMLMALGFQSFKGLFLNPTPPLAFIIILGFHLVARFFNLNTTPSNSEFLIGMFSLFGYGSNLVVGDKIVETLYAGGFPEPPTVEVQEPPVQELQMGDPNPLDMNESGGGGNAQPAQP